MPIPTIDTTIGGSFANSYVTEAEAESYHDARLDTSAWSESTSDNKKRALLMAAQRLEKENWLGGRVTRTQRLAWPRLNVQKVDGISGGWGGYGGYGWLFGDVYLTTEIPQQVKDSQCEFALLFLASSSGGASAGGIESFTVDGLNVKFAGEGTIAAVVDDSRAIELIAGLVAGNQLRRA